MTKIRLRVGDWSGSAIKMRRLKLNLTQKELAKKIGCHHNTIFEYEHNEYHPSAAVLGRLIAVLLSGVNDASDLYRSNYKPPSKEYLLTKQDLFRIVKKHIPTGEKP